MHLMVVVLPAPFWPSSPVELTGGDVEIDTVDSGELAELSYEPARPDRGASRGVVDDGLVGEGLGHCLQVSTVRADK